MKRRIGLKVIDKLSHLASIEYPFYVSLRENIKLHNFNYLTHLYFYGDICLGMHCIERNNYVITDIQKALKVTQYCIHAFTLDRG